MNALVALLAALPLGGGNVFVVDDDGPADFPDLVTAIASPLVVDGDTLVVRDGVYEAFELTKALHLVGVRERSAWGEDLPYVERGSLVLDVPYFSLVGFELDDLGVMGVPGRSRIEDCDFNSLWGGVVGLVDCGALVVSRCAFQGAISCYPDGPSVQSEGVYVGRSDVVFSGCVIRGGGEDWTGECATHYAIGLPGMIVEDGSRVLVSDCDVFAFPFSLTSLWGPTPAIVVSGSDVEVRSGSDRQIIGFDGNAIALTDQSTAVVSGAHLVPDQPGGGVVVLDELRPHLRHRGGTSPGQWMEFELLGPEGAPMLLALALEGPPIQVERSFVPLLVDPDGLLAIAPFVTQGRDTPVGLGLLLPTDPALAGLRLTAQALMTSPAGDPPLPTGPVDLTLRH